MWNALIAADRRKAFQLSLDEERALYAFYLSRPHPSQAMREAIAAARHSAPDAARCRALDEAERVGAEKWRLEHIARLSAVDAAYPGAYARGVASYRSGDFHGAAEAFQTWLGDHPDGPLALRARTYLRAAMGAVPSD
jgi:TolA-binding protein